MRKLRDAADGNKKTIDTFPEIKYPFDEWDTIFYDEKLTMAILDRIVRHGHMVMHEGQSYRLSRHTPYPIKP